MGSPLLDRRKALIPQLRDNLVARVIAYYALLTAGALALRHFVPPLDVLRGGSARSSATPPGRSGSLAEAFGSSEPLVATSQVSYAGIAMVVAGLLALPVAWLYILTRRKKGYRQSVVQTLIILPMAVAGVVVLVKNSLALAFSLSGIVAAVRFRNTLEDSKDAVYIFLATAVGLGAGVDPMVAVVISVAFNLAVVLLWWTDFGRSPALFEGSRAEQSLEKARVQAGRTTSFVAKVDESLFKSMSAEQLDALADRAWRRRKRSTPELEVADRPDFDTLLRVTTTDIAAAKAAAEVVLREQIKRWRFGGVVHEPTAFISSNTPSTCPKASHPARCSRLSRAGGARRCLRSSCTRVSAQTATVTLGGSMGLASVLLALAVPVAAQSGLFDEGPPLALTLEADWGTVFKDRDTLSTEYYPATISVAGPDGSQLTVPLKIRARGHWRLKSENCDFPPLLLNFSEQKNDSSLFAGQDKLKLGTHCRSKSDEYEQYVLREYLVYRVYNRLTPIGFRVRLARVTYVDHAGKREPLTKWAFFVESEEAMAKRNGGVILKGTGMTYGDLDPFQGGLVAAFEYMVGGTDWSLLALHNIRLIQSETLGKMVPVPYDFDYAGVVDTRYAVPDPRLQIKSVRERVYRGNCRTVEAWAPVLQRFTEERDSIYALYRGQADLNPKYANEAIKYYDQFYEVIGNPKSLKRELVEPCKPEG